MYSGWLCARATLEIASAAARAAILMHRIRLMGNLLRSGGLVPRYQQAENSIFSSKREAEGGVRGRWGGVFSVLYWRGKISSLCHSETTLPRRSPDAYL